MTFRGPAAAFLREYLALDAAERRAHAEAAGRDAKVRKVVEGLIGGAVEAIDLLVDAAFFAAGMHRAAHHDWRPWRRGQHWLSISRGMGQFPAQSKLSSKPSSASQEPAAFTELRKWVHFARADDATVLPRIREIIEHYPKVWHHVVERIRAAETTAVQFLAANTAARTQLTDELAVLRESHCAAPAMALHQRLVDRAVLHVVTVKLLQHSLGPPAWTKREQNRLRAAQNRADAAWQHYRDLEWRLPKIDPPDGVQLFVAGADDGGNDAMNSAS